MKKQCFTLLILILLTTGIKSQSFLPDGFDYSLEFINTGQTENATDTIYTIKVIIDNNGITDIAALKVKVWKTQTIDAEVLFEHSFINNVSASTPEGTDLEISEGKTTILIGNYLLGEYAYEVTLESSTGELSKPGRLFFEE
ncbi:MAG: hypothetical protein A2W91_12995 [Bacteroidetes bacterium GWF2_38_335]|nr:MAG: hypothetical protein A2W91_12995 [Bacteroidetes bacterium GWF2_38_335]HBS86941.1 hypothetical protein [Bacteroidales bacterium]